MPYDRGDIVALAHEQARVLDTVYEEEGTRIRLLATEPVARRLESVAAQHARV